MDAKQFTPYIAAPSSVIQSYVGNSSSSAANATVPSVSELQALQSELHSIQQDLSDREQKLRADEERLRSFRPNAKGKPKEQYDKPATVPFGGTNGAQPAVDKKMLNRLKRAGSGLFSLEFLSQDEIGNLRKSQLNPLPLICPSQSQSKVDRRKSRGLSVFKSARLKN